MDACVGIERRDQAGAEEAQVVDLPPDAHLSLFVGQARVGNVCGRRLQRTKVFEDRSRDPPAHRLEPDPIGIAVPQVVRQQLRDEPANGVPAPGGGGDQETLLDADVLVALRSGGRASLTG